MKNIISGRWGQAAGRLVVAVAVVYLAGCRFQITADANGHVYTNLGADCTRYCNYVVNTGEEFVRELSAVPEPGSEFVRWEDSFGESFEYCVNPTATSCKIDLEPVVEEIEGIDVSLNAKFRYIDGYNLNYVKLASADSNGFFRPLNLSYWVEHRGNGTKTYRVIHRFQTGLYLLDEESGRNYILSLQSGDFVERIGDGQQRFISAIVGMSTRTSGWTVDRVIYGNTGGVRIGEFNQQPDGSWVMSTDFEGDSDVKLSEDARSHEVLQLRTETGEAISINLDSGEITEGSAASTLTGYVHEAFQPINGWSVSEASYADPETGEIIGSYRRLGVGKWEEYDSEGRLIAQLEERERTASIVALQDSLAGRAIHLDFESGMVAIGPVTNLWPQPRWNMANVR